MLDPLDVEPTPWRNGAGSTRELASSVDPDGGTGWRISVASLDADAAFSTFPGLDRVFVPAGPVRLSVDGREHDLAAGEQLRFAGEAAVSVSLSAPTSALNVMTRRGTCRALVTLRDPAEPGADLAVASVLLPGAVADVFVIPVLEELHV